MGAVGLVGALLVDPSVYRRYYKAIYGVLLGMLLVVTVIGTEVRGSTRWIDLGFFQFQPSEFGKLLLAPVPRRPARRAGEADHRVAHDADRDRGGVGADALRLPSARHRDGARVRRDPARVPVLRRTRWRDLAIVAVGTVVVAFVLWAGPAMGVEILEPYQRDRLVHGPVEEPRGAAYNINQSITAVGSGGLDGRGVAGATQTRLDYLPEHETDFVFAALSEQRGFVGASILLCLYLLLLWRGIRVIATAQRLRGNGCGRDRLRPALPDVREHRDIGSLRSREFHCPSSEARRWSRI